MITKTLLSGLVIVSLVLNVNGQTLGTYEYQEQLNSRTISLTDSGFVMSSGAALNHSSFLTKGDFYNLGDTLVLKSNPWTENDSYFEVISKLDSSTPVPGKTVKYGDDYLSLEIELVDKDLNPTEAPIVFSEGLTKPIFSTFLDKSGKFNITTWNKRFKLLRIGGLATYRGVKIDLNQFRGHASKIRVILKHLDWNKYDKSTYTYFFLINNSDSTLTQINPDGKLGDQFRLGDK